MTVPRLSDKPCIRYINWSPYIRLLADKTVAIYNFSFLDLFEGNSNVIEKITKFDASKFQIFLFNFTNLIDRVGIKEAVDYFILV